MARRWIVEDHHQQQKDCMLPQRHIIDESISPHFHLLHTHSPVFVVVVVSFVLWGSNGGTCFIC